MAPAVAWLIFFQLALESALVLDINKEIAIKNFRDLYTDYPKVDYPRGFHGYCNGLMGYVRGIRKSWYCPRTHYVIHAPWTIIQHFCKYSENFCENYNEYCTVTQDTNPITICTLAHKQPPSSCYYNSTMGNYKIYLLCSHKYDAEPIDVIGIA
nr:LOW QUALITY PROTEIN: probable inactive ribonuclease-like protein 13 [Dasypus novemcinctus]